jgi:hypothetical protein
MVNRHFQSRFPMRLCLMKSPLWIVIADKRRLRNRRGTKPI